MAWFRCMVGGGNALELIVTCAAAFAGQTITCTDGTSTLTATCPSSSPYEITFKLPNYGTWTVSGTTGGQTYTESIVVQPYEVELTNLIDITIDVYSAANDTVSYTGLDGQTHTITTDSSGHATATITIYKLGSSITFTSSVAKDITTPTNPYAKTITLISTTTSIYLMPDKCAYWYGWNGANMVAVNGYDIRIPSYSNLHAAPTLTKSTNFFTASFNQFTGEGLVLSNHNLSGLSGKIAKGVFENTIVGDYKSAGVLGAVQASQYAYTCYHAASSETIAVDEAKLGILLHDGESTGSITMKVYAVWAE